MFTKISEYFVVPNGPDFEYQRTHKEELRKSECSRIRAKYPDRCPVICEVTRKDRNRLKLDKNKYLVPRDITVGQFAYIIRRRLKLTPEQAMFIYLENNTFPSTSQLIGTIAHESKNEDGFLYITIGLENTFG